MTKFFDNKSPLEGERAPMFFGTLGETFGDLCVDPFVCRKGKARSSSSGLLESAASS